MRTISLDIKINMTPALLLLLLGVGSFATISGSGGDYNEEQIKLLLWQIFTLLLTIYFYRSRFRTGPRPSYFHLY